MSSTTDNTGLANATIAARLKHAGFNRGVSSWEKDDFRTAIWNKDEDSRIEIKVRIHRDWTGRKTATGKTAWVISNPVITTEKRTGDNFRMKEGMITFTPEMLNKLNDLMKVVDGLR